MIQPISVFKKARSLQGLCMGLVYLASASASALELDWSGQFWSELQGLINYTMDASPNGGSADLTRENAGGYYVRGGGVSNASFQSLFMRLRPKMVVNDNIYIKSEFWLGDPQFGLFGSAYPYSPDQRQFYSSQSRGATLTAQRFWAEILTDVGTIQVGRVPLNWGLGIFWNSGENLWDRYMSTGDAVRWFAKFGSFSLIPSVVMSSTGNTIGGACLVQGGPGSETCSGGLGSAGVTDYSIILKYENMDDDLEAGVNVIKRLAGSSQDPNYGVLVPETARVPGVAAQQAGSVNLMTYDLFVRKKFKKLTLSGELPIVSGEMGPSKVNTFGFAGEADYKWSSSLGALLRVGYAPGQNNADAASRANFNAFYFNPNYHLGMILFNYQLANFSRPQTLNNPKLSPTGLRSIYDNPIVNATYLALSVPFKPTDQFTIQPTLIYASALQSASAGDPYFYNSWQRTNQPNQAGRNQGKDLGLEADVGVTYQWDDAVQIRWDGGVFFPGSFFAFSNAASGVENSTSPVLATALRVGVNF
ncbi:MAG: hypothetical protein ACO3A2_00800 [Bdellovibrionia bacterium]